MPSLRKKAAITGIGTLLLVGCIPDRAWPRPNASVSRGGHGAVAGCSLRDGGGHYCLVVVGEPAGWREYRREPAAGAVSGVLVRLEHPGGLARAEARPEGRRRAGDSCRH